MPLEQRPEMPRDDRQLDHFRERKFGQRRNNLWHQAVFRRRLDHQSQLRRGLGEGHGRFRRGILRAIDDVAPMNQLGERLHVKTKFRAGHVRQELGAGLVIRIVEFVAAAILAEILRVGGSQERALVMVKPPGHARRTRIFEIDDGIFIAVKQAVLERLPRLVSHPREMKLRVGLDALAKKTIEDRRRRRAIEASVVKAQPNFDRVCHCPPTPSHCKTTRNAEWKALKDGWERRECQDEKGAR